MKPKFHPSPSTISIAQKCIGVMPDMPIAAAVASSASPIATITGAPKRAMREPVKKLGPYIATMCH